MGYSVHKLKINSEFFGAVVSGHKKAEMRRDDRGFSIGDSLVLREVKDGNETGNLAQGTITHILRNTEYGIEPGYAMLSFELQSMVLTSGAPSNF